MIKLLRKEIQLAASPLSYFFIGFGLMAFVPGYPILVGSFFVCLGLFQSFQTAREANDLTYTALLPVAKDVYKRQPSQLNWELRSRVSSRTSNG